MDKHRNYAPIAILVITAAIAFGLYALKSDNPFFKKNFKGEEAATMKVDTVSSVQGGVVEGFPAELILPKDAIIQHSSNVRIESKRQNIYSVTYFTNATLPNTFAAYLSYLADKGFRVFLSDVKPTKSNIAAQGAAYNLGVAMALIDSKTLKVDVSVTKTEKP
jgi:hypothetical protein